MNNNSRDDSDNRIEPDSTPMFRQCSPSFNFVSLLKLVTVLVAIGPFVNTVFTIYCTHRPLVSRGIVTQCLTQLCVSPCVGLTKILLSLQDRAKNLHQPAGLPGVSENSGL
jgi:hypothetical protein